MLVFLPLGLLAVFIGLWWYRRGSSLTRQCRWRRAGHLGDGWHLCAACGAQCQLPEGREPRECLNPRRVKTG